MPTAAPHPCGNPVCPALAPRGERFCVACKRIQARALERADRERRGTATSRGYGATWTPTRDRIRARDFRLCRYCQNVDVLTEGTIVDHVRPRSAGGTDDDQNLALCCRNCDNEKKIRHDGGFGRPLDPIDRVEQFVPTWHRARGAA